MEYNDKMAIIVPAYDGNIDVFKEYLKYFKRNWSDCPFEMILVTQTTRFSDERVTSIISSENSLWTARVLKALEHTKCKYILTCIEDGFICDKVNTKYVFDVLDFMDNNSIKYYRNPKHKSKQNRKCDFISFPYAQKIIKNKPYSRSLGIDIWERSTLINLFGDGKKSAWEIEQQFNEEAQHEKRGYYDEWVSDKNNFLNIVEVVNKGMWIPKAISIFEKKGMPINLGNRKVMPLKTVLKDNIISFCGKFTPSVLRKPIKSFLRKLHVKFATNN